MVLLGLMRDMLHFGVVIQWRLIFQVHLDRAHLIIRELLF
jgi:hypothetical protein